MRCDLEYKPNSRRNGMAQCVQHALQVTEEKRADLARLREFEQEVQRMQQREDARLANAKKEGLEPKSLLEMEKEANDRYLWKTFGQISLISRRSRCGSAPNSQSSIQTQGEVPDTCSSTSKASPDSTQETNCTHVPSQDEDKELGSLFISDTLGSSGKSTASDTVFPMDWGGRGNGGEGMEGLEAFESPRSSSRSTADGSLYVLGDAWAEEEVQHFGQVISARLNSTKLQPASKPAAGPASAAATPQGSLNPPSPASAPALPDPSAAAPPVTLKANSVVRMLGRIKQQISAWDGKRKPKSAGRAASTASTSRATSRGSSMNGRQSPCRAASTANTSRTASEGSSLNGRQSPCRAASTASTSRATSRACSMNAQQETAPKRSQPAPDPAGSSMTASARTAASQLTQPRPPSKEPPTTPTRPSTEDRGLAGRNCSASRSPMTIRQPPRAGSRKLGHGHTGAEVFPPLRPNPLFAQTSRPGQDKSSAPACFTTPDLMGTSSAIALEWESPDHHQPQHHLSGRIPSMFARRSSAPGEGMQPASDQLTLQIDPRVLRRSSLPMPEEVTQGQSLSQSLQGPLSTPHEGFAEPWGAPVQGTCYRLSMNRSSSSSSSLASIPEASPALGTYRHKRSSTSSSLAFVPKASAKTATVAATTACAASEPLACIDGTGQVGAQPQPQHRQPARKRKSMSIMLHRRQSESSVTDAISEVLPL
ncbi:hypothetical protein DUNSADRAFT_11766 [Dunaliella salina]|uniref:Uncharacterized protein n=1 Tax=Dunaliella salina TaxID=3046 RepID=A0ABQ7GCM2_DUNSA|nr:hypothetical protein DUNSADRAFT_11766 [Dunaliella salina]|eukprot:KAF5832356.1 hypothetical protein DUNSADRAFT_11766 [Dunaliella salina]